MHWHLTLSAAAVWIPIPIPIPIPQVMSQKKLTSTHIISFKTLNAQATRTMKFFHTRQICDVTILNAWIDHANYNHVCSALAAEDSA